MTESARCPYTQRVLVCTEKSCDGCPVFADHQRRENDQIAEGVKDVWKCQAAGAHDNSGKD